VKHENEMTTFLTSFSFSSSFFSSHGRVSKATTVAASENHNIFNIIIFTGSGGKVVVLSRYYRYNNGSFNNGNDIMVGIISGLYHNRF